MQITLGKRRKNDGNNSITSKKISTEETYHPTEASKPELKIGEAGVGDFVALRLEKYEDEIPQIAKVVGKDGFDVTVEWWVGTYSNLWTEWKEKKTSCKRNCSSQCNNNESTAHQEQEATHSSYSKAKRCLQQH